MLLDLTPLLDAIERNTAAAERLAGALEQAELTLMRTEEPLETPQHFNVPTMPAAAAPAEGDKPKRKRRTKAEIAADEAAAAMGQPAAAAAPAPAPAPAMPAAFGNFTASPTPPVVLGSGVAAQVLQQAQATAQAAVQLDAQATAEAQRATQAAQASSAFTVQAQAPAPTQPSAPVVAAVAPAQLAPVSVQRADLSVAALQYQQLPADQQFGHLNALFTQANNALPVRDALVGAVKAAGLDLPISDQADRSKPSAGYAALSNPARWSIYEATYRALEDVKAATV